MITGNEARRWTFDTEDKYWIVASIREAIYDAISNQKFHCEWYSPARYDLTDNDIDLIEEHLAVIQSMGFVVSRILFDKTDEFSDRRMKVHINWENNT